MRTLTSLGRSVRNYGNGRVLFAEEGKKYNKKKMNRNTKIKNCLMSEIVIYLEYKLELGQQYPEGVAGWGSYPKTTVKGSLITVHRRRYLQLSYVTEAVLKSTPPKKWELRST